jgi:peptidyl-prolyl cis-trans isomerase SurA
MSGIIPTAINWRVLLIAAAVLVPTTVTAIAQNVAAIVNGEPITALDIEQRSKFIALSIHKSPPRQEVLDELINEKLKVREAKRFGLESTDSEVDTAFGTMAGRLRMSADQLTRTLASSGISDKTLKTKIRADLVWQQLVRGRFQSTFQIDDKDITTAIEGKKTSEPDAATIDYTLRPILFLVPPGAGETAFDGRRREAEALRGRFRGCGDGLPAARSLRDVTVRDPVTRSSADVPPEMRKILDGIPVGQLTPPERTRLGVEMIAICDKRESKSETLAKRQARDSVMAERFEQQSKRYLQEVRRGALIEYR